MSDGKIKFRCSEKQLRAALREHCGIKSVVIGNDDDVAGAAKTLLLNTPYPNSAEVVEPQEYGINNGCAICHRSDARDEPTVIIALKEGGDEERFVECVRLIQQQIFGGQ